MRCLLAFSIGVIGLATAAEPIGGQEKAPPKAPYDRWVRWESLDSKGKLTHYVERVAAQKQATKPPTWIVDGDAVLFDNAGIPKQARITTEDDKVIKIKEVRKTATASLLCIVDDSPPAKKK